MLIPSTDAECAIKLIGGIWWKNSCESRKSDLSRFADSDATLQTTNLY